MTRSVKYTAEDYYNLTSPRTSERMQYEPRHVQREDTAQVAKLSYNHGKDVAVDQYGNIYFLCNRLAVDAYGDAYVGTQTIETSNTDYITGHSGASPDENAVTIRYV